MAKKHDLDVYETKDVAQLQPMGLNLLKLFQECCGDLNDALERLDAVGQDDPEDPTLLERLVGEMLQLVTSGAKDTVRVRAAEVIARIYGEARQDAAKVRIEIARVAADSQRNLHQVLIAERQIEAQQKTAGSGEMTNAELEKYLAMARGDA